MLSRFSITLWALDLLVTALALTAQQRNCNTACRSGGGDRAMLRFGASALWVCLFWSTRERIYLPLALLDV
jgi:hypothetical protein